MLVQLMPDQISRYWNQLEKMLVQALPPVASKKAESLDNMLEASLIGTMQCWVVCHINENATDIIGAVATTFTGDPCSKTSDLLIYAFAATGDMKKLDWIELYQTLAKFAKSKGCDRLTAYTADTGIIEFVRRIGGGAEQAYLTFPLDKF